MNIDYENERRKEKLSSLSNEGKLNLIWGWIKDGSLDRHRFKELINFYSKNYESFKDGGSVKKVKMNKKPNQLLLQFVPLEIAVKLKELGFNEPCFAYLDKTETDENKKRPYGKPSITEGGYYDNSEYGGSESELIAAPTYQQVVDWIENNHKIIISRDRHINNGFRYWVYNNNEVDIECYKMNKNEALNKAIEEALKLISNEKFKNGGSVKKEKVNKMKNDTFTEIADYGDAKYFIRDFGNAIIGDNEDNEKEIPLVLVAKIFDMYDATGEDEFKDKPFVISIDILAEKEYIDKKNITSVAGSSGIEDEDVQYTDIVDYGYGIPLLSADLEQQFTEFEEAEEFLLSNDMRKQLSAREMMIGLYLDGSINRAGESRWSHLEEMVNGK